jgi:hypothetical protein
MVSLKTKYSFQRVRDLDDGGSDLTLWTVEGTPYALRLTTHDDF